VIAFGHGTRVMASPLTNTQIAVAGASGFVGLHLIERLAASHPIIALGRRAPSQSRDGVEWRQTELFSAGSTRAALQGATVAIYLVHSMMPSSRLFQGSFHDTDLLLADNFARACKKNGVQQIIYLGGLVPPSGFVSPHLQSRKEVEAVLGRHRDSADGAASRNGRRSRRLLVRDPALAGAKAAADGAAALDPEHGSGGPHRRCGRGATRRR
jgi:nucleoside-diphosphate-sugar epimerase